MHLRVLILDNAVHRFLFRPPWHWRAYLREAGVDVDVVNVPSGQTIPSLDAYTHLLVTGSEASIVEPSPWFEREAATIQDAADRELTVLGSCFGHQMLVYALSGSDYVRQSPSPEIGWIALQKCDDDELLADAPDPWHTFSYHFDEVVDPPPPWRVLARSRGCPVQVIRYGDGPIWGIQAHPELPLAKARFFLAVYLLFARRDRRRLVSAMRKPSHEDRITGTVVTRFLAAGRDG